MNVASKIIDTIPANYPFEKASASLLMAQPDALVYADTDRIIQKINPSFTRIFGYTPEEITGKSTEIIYSDSRLFHEQGRLRFNSGSRHPPASYDMTYKRKNGEMFNAVSIGFTVRNSWGRAVGFMLLLRDVTAGKQMESDYIHLGIESQNRRCCRFESLGRLAGGVAHDINNLLFPIIGHTDILLEDLPEASQYRESVAEVRKAAAKIQKLLRQLLVFGRKQTLEAAPLNLNTILKNFKTLLQKTIQKDVFMEIILAEKLPLIHADNGQVEQIIMNLVVNAGHAMPDGGNLQMETGTGTMPGTDNPCVFFCVRDNGIGMDDQTCCRIFDPFFTTRASGQGTGLGLSTVSGIVQQHRGQIQVRSKPGEGSCFTVYLPGNDH